MTKEIHYDADIFYMTLVVRTVRKACTLTIDPDFFLDKIVEDIIFADKVLKSIMEHLRGNDLQINIEQHLRNLYLAKRDLAILLEDICSKTLPFSKYLEQYESRFTQIIRSQKTDMIEIDDTLNFDERQIDKKNMVSSDEYQILFDNEE